MEEDAPVSMNRDGKFWDSFFPSILSAGIALIGFAVLQWVDIKSKDTATELAISRLDREITAIKGDMREARRDAAVDRSRTSDLAADVKVLLAVTQRIETTILGDGAPAPRIPIPATPR